MIRIASVMQIEKLYRKLKDSQLIYIAYAKSNELSRVSYVERMVRSFNLLRILENSRVIWNLMNSTFRLKMVVPIGNKSPHRAKENLAELMSVYKEDVDLNFDSGELFVNGRPGIQFYKNYLMPSKEGEQVTIDTLSPDGPDLSDVEALGYFKEKLKNDSKVPFSRFDKASGGGSLSMGADGLERDEIRFSKFINRLRSKFQEIIFKPLYIQMILDNPELEGDELFKSQIGFKFNKDNEFQEIKEQELMQRRSDFIQTMMNLQDDKGKPFFDVEYLIERYLYMSQDERDKNEEYKKKRDKPAEGGGDEESSAGTDNFGF